jgi:hypothetical protein
MAGTTITFMINLAVKRSVFVAASSLITRVAVDMKKAITATQLGDQTGLFESKPKFYRPNNIRDVTFPPKCWKLN